METISTINKQQYKDEYLSRDKYELSMKEKEALENSTIAILGTGSIGGPLAKSLAMIGAENLVLVDPEVVDLSNISHQCGTFEDVLNNVPKVEVVKQEALSKFPYSNIITHPEGANLENMEDIIKNTDLVVWGIDFSRPDLVFALHEISLKYKKIVYSGLDLGDSTLFRYWDYSISNEIFDGLVKKSDLEKYNPIQILAKTITNVEENVPVSVLQNLIDIALGKESHLSQTNVAASLFGVVGARHISKLLAYGSKESGVSKQSLIKTDYLTMSEDYIQKKEVQKRELLKHPIVKALLNI